MARKFKAQLEEFTMADGDGGLPVDAPAAVYYRQSTDAQVGNISTAIQTVDMVKELERLGWQKDSIFLIDMDGGVSGTTRIDERKGMRQLFEMIVERQIRLVACQDEDRLFRDVTQIQVNIFIEACRKSRVLVMTPYFTYDFGHPLHGDHHARQFRFKSEMAAEYIKSYIQGRMHPARRRLGKEGKWFGAKIPVGFMVDDRKLLPDGNDNPNWRKFVPFEPYAEIVRAYFHVFLECGGCVRKAMLRIKAERITFPDCKPPKGFKVNYQLKWREDGYYMTRSNIERVLTNPMYAGHWTFENVVLFWNNHTPIIDKDTFARAFNYLSKCSLTGDENPDYRPSYQRALPKLEENRNVERPLCPGLIFTEEKGRWFPVHVIWLTKPKCYAYKVSSHNYIGTKALWERHASWFDSVIVNRFRRKLTSSFKPDLWAQAVTELDETVEKELKFKLAQKTALEEAMKNLVASLETASTPDFVRNIEKRYEQMQGELRRLNSDIGVLEEGRNRRFSLEQLYELFTIAVNSWDEMTQDERRNVLRHFVNRIEVSDFSRAGNMKIVVFWYDKSEDEIQINRKPKSPHWPFDNIEKLLSLFDGGANQLEIAAAFPDLVWYQIYNELKKHRGRVRFTPSWLGKQETYNDYVASGGRKGKASGSFWQPQELEKLKQMVEGGTTQLEVMKAFPFRRWIQLQERIRKIYGRGQHVEPSGINRRLTYQDVERGITNPTPDSSSEIEVCCSLSRPAPFRDFLLLRYLAAQRC